MAIETRKDLAKLFKGEGAEIGVERGTYSEVILKTNPDIYLHLVDPWLHYEDYRAHVSQDQLDDFYITTQSKLKQYNVTFHRKTSAEALLDFKDESLDFVYIDANHSLDHATHDIEEWSKKVKPGGIVSGHDYVKKPVYGVREAVYGYVTDHNIKDWFILQGDRSPSYYWIK